MLGVGETLAINGFRFCFRFSSIFCELQKGRPGRVARSYPAERVA